MKHLYDSAAIQCSRIITATYSTSFSIGVRCLHRDLRDPIHSIYGFVRLADEIVDSFHEFNKRELLHSFSIDTYRAIRDGISLNPILNSFQFTVNKFGISHDLIELFLKSMLMDIDKNRYDAAGLKQYVVGSAEVVGLMCLRVFCQNDERLYQKLRPHAMSLGSAFQKVNFLRDIRDDYSSLGRSYFPDVDPSQFDNHRKQLIEKSIEQDFHHAYEGIVKLPRRARLGVYVAYVYYRVLFRKIQSTPAEEVMARRIRIPNLQKAWLFAWCYIAHKFGMTGQLRTYSPLAGESISHSTHSTTAPT